VNLEIPDDVVRSVRMSPDELRIEFAVFLFQQDRFTLGQAARFAGMSSPDFQHHLGHRKISLHYGVEDLIEDVKTLEEFDRST